MKTVSINVDVPDLADAVRFYEDALGFQASRRPMPAAVVITAGVTEIWLLERPEGSRVSRIAPATRSYARHWTPVHLDIHVDDLDSALARAVAAGAVCEGLRENTGHGAVAFCSDPFGHGFCLIERVVDRVATEEEV